MSKKCPYCMGTVTGTMDPMAQAQAEVAAEKFREEVDQCKTKLRSKKPWFPWRVRIVRIK